MGYRTDQNYLKNQQYRDASNLNARIALHKRFSTNRYDWFRWVFDHFELPAQARLLELGCGPARLWQGNLDRIPPGWQITLSDLSPGMLAEAQRELNGQVERFNYEVIDAQTIPFPDASFDAVIANHILYHVPDRPKALAEIRRVLKPGGWLYAATNGDRHMNDLDRLAERLAPHLADIRQRNFGHLDFTLENGTAQLTPYFYFVQMEPYIDSLHVTEVEPLVAYLLSMGTLAEMRLTETDLDRFRAWGQAEIENYGYIPIEKATGLFQARKAVL